MNMPLFSLKSLSLAVLLCAASAAHGAITLYTDQAAFLAAVTAPGVDTFDDLTQTFYPSPLLRNAGPYTYTVSAPNDLYGVGSGSDTWLATDLRDDTMTFSNFSPNIGAFGGNFFGTDVAGEFTPGNVVLTAVDGTSLSYTLKDATPTSFVGFVSTTPLSSVLLSTDGGLYWPTANNVTLASPAAVVTVPEPGAASLVLGGLGIVGFMTRRRRRTFS